MPPDAEPQDAGLPRTVGDVEAPDTRVCRLAYEVCAAYAWPALRNHSVRAYFLAAAYARTADVPYDQELLFVACLLHDLALTEPFDSHTVAFEEAGAHLASVFAAGAGWSRGRRGRLEQVIRLHMSDDTPVEEDAESHLLQVAVGADVSGRGLERFDTDFLARLLATVPRGDFAASFLRRAHDQAERKPRGAAACLMGGGWERRILGNPLDRL